MALDDGGALVDDLLELVGDDLRVVATYDPEGYDALYVADGVAGHLKHQADRVHDELVLQGLGRGHLEDLFDAGDLHCSMHRFDDLTAFHFASEEFAGLFVSLASDADVPLASFAETCERHL